MQSRAKQPESMSSPLADRFFTDAPLWLVGLLLLGALTAVAELGFRAHRWLFVQERGPQDSKDEGYILSAVLGLLALLVGFTFSMALNRYETRRELVVQEANAIGTARLIVQVLEDPRRSELTALFARYVDLRLMGSREHADPATLGETARVRRELWEEVSEVSRAHPTAQSSRALIDAVTAMFDVAAARRAELDAYIPTRVLEILVLYAIVSAGVLGYVLAGTNVRHFIATSILFVALTLAITLVLDIDRPRRGSIRVPQQPMLDLETRGGWGGGSDRSPGTPAVAPTQVRWLVTEFGIGPLRAGMTVAEAARVVVRSFTAPPGAATEGCTYAVWPDAPPGVAVMIEDGHVARIDVTSGPVATAAGARVGDTEERIQTLYRGRVGVTPHKYTEGHYLVVSSAADDAYRIVFETDGRRVTRYRSGRRPAVEYVEGCG